MNETPRADDPWAAFGRIAGGVLVYGLIGWLLDRWWDTSFMVAIGIVTGAALGIVTIMLAQRDR